jgi:hypothetical protein
MNEDDNRNVDFAMAFQQLVDLVYVCLGENAFIDVQFHLIGEKAFGYLKGPMGMVVRPQAKAAFAKPAVRSQGPAFKEIDALFGLHDRIDAADGGAGFGLDELVSDTRDRP